MPLPVEPPVPVKPVQASSASPGMAASIAAQSRMAAPILPAMFPRQADDRPVLSAIPFAMGSADGVPKAAGTGTAAGGPQVAISAAHPANKQVRISSGVADGLLIAPIRPVYPSIARIARVQGTVIVAAIISRTGTIDKMRVISGPVMLQQAALDAIRAARYQPYRLNGSPTEVQTTISINFRLGN
jgi:protein TonB